MDEYKIGDLVLMPLAIRRWRVWLDRVRLWRWDVPEIEDRSFRCTGVAEVE